MIPRRNLALTAKAVKRISCNINLGGNTMKKLIAVALAVVMVLSLGACSV